MTTDNTEVQQENGQRVVDRVKPVVMPLLYNGDCTEFIKKYDGNIDCLITSPPYFNAKEYANWPTYGDYLEFMRKVIDGVYSMLDIGGYFICNTSPVISPRAKRSEQSERHPIPFDLHRLFSKYEFMEDIVWVKPDSSSIGRGRRFSADRRPQQYRANAITEYVMVYRKPGITIDKKIQTKDASRVLGKYEKTNVWRIEPEKDKEHPAVMPYELLRNCVKYWTFRGDVIFDPFMGSGRTGEIAKELGRGFVGCEINPEYFKTAQSRIAA